MRKVYVIITGIFLTLLFTACKQFTADIEDYLSYWAAEVSPMDNSIDKPHPKNAEGVRCVSSGNPVTVTIKLRNPKNLPLRTPISSTDAGKIINFPGQSTQPTYGTDYTLQQTANDKLELTYKLAFLQRCEWSESSIGADITLISTDGRQFNTTASIKLEANTPPPKPTAVLAQTNSASPTYVLCLQVPDMGVSVTGGLLHKDIVQIEINGTSYPLTVSGGDFVKPSDAHFITAVTQLVGYPAPPAGAWVLYYDTGLSVGNAYQAYTVKLKDNKGLVSAVLETGTARPPLSAETVTIARGQQGAGSGTGDTQGAPIIINGETSAPEAQITIQNIAGTTVHCTVQEVVGGSATGAVSPYDGNPVNVPLGLGTANEKIYEVKYHTDGEGYTQTSTTTKYYKVLKCHSVTFDANGGTFTDGSTTSTSRTVLVPHNTAAAAPSGTDVPARAGYTLGSSWYTEAGCTTQWNFTTPITGNITLYAKWAPNSGTSYRVEHYKEDLTENQYTSAPQIDTPTGTTGAATVATPKNYPGFEFDRQDPVSATIAGDNSTVVKVYYKRKSINVTFNLNGGTISGSMSNVIRTGRFGTTLTPPNPVKTGYTFSSWGPNVGSPPLSMPPKFPANDAAYTAQWTAKTDTPYRVEHYKEDLTENQYTSAPQIENPTGTTGDVITVTQKTYEGFELDRQDPPSATIAADGSTVVKVYYKRKSINVTFNPNGGTISGGASNLTVSGRFGTALTAPADPVKTGYTFSSWSPSLPSTLEFPSSNAAYTAQWTANTYKVRFNGNGNTGGTAMSDRTFTYDAAGNLPLNAFIKTGYTFSGWATSSGSTTVVRTNGAAANNLTDTQGGTVDLYAVWTEDHYTVQFCVESGTGTLTAQITGGTSGTSNNSTLQTLASNITYGKTVTFTAAPELAWEVDGWTGITASPSSTTATLTVTGNTTVKVTFKKTTTIKSTDPQPWKLLKEVVRIADDNAVITINGEIKATNEGSAGVDANWGEIEINKNLTIKKADGATTAVLNANSNHATAPADAPATPHRIFKVTGNKTLTLQNLTLKGGKDEGTLGVIGQGGAITVSDSGGEAELTNCIIEDCQAEYGGAIGCYSGTTVTLTNTTIQKCKATERGGAIFAEGSTVNITSCTLKGNEAKVYGGAIFAQNSGSTPTIVTVSGGTIGGTNAADANKTTGTEINEGMGGGIYMAPRCTLNMLNNVQVIGNTAKKGGGVYAFGTTVTLTNCTLKGNTAKSGGAIYAKKSGSNVSTVTIEGGTIGGTDTNDANKATGTGADEGQGGGIWVGDACSLNLKDSTDPSSGVQSLQILGNRAQKGQGIYAKNTIVSMKDTLQINANNDVYLDDGTKIRADSNLNPPGGFTARITVPDNKYNTSTQVLIAGSGVDLASEAGKFAVTPKGSEHWIVGNSGTLLNFGAISLNEIKVRESSMSTALITNRENLVNKLLFYKTSAGNYGVMVVTEVNATSHSGHGHIEFNYKTFNADGSVKKERDNCELEGFFRFDLDADGNFDFFLNNSSTQNFQPQNGAKFYVLP